MNPSEKVLVRTVLVCIFAQFLSYVLNFCFLLHIILVGHNLSLQIRTFQKLLEGSCMILAFSVN